MSANRCRVSVPPNGDDCPNPPIGRIAWPDGDKTPACEECILRLGQIAESHQKPIKVEPLESP